MMSRHASVSGLLREYFDGFDRPEPMSSMVQHDFLTDTRSLPVTPKETSSWQVLQGPERLHRTFNFRDRASLRYFLNEVLEMEEDLQHHGDITVSGLSVTIEIFTHQINRVTELDKEYANEVDAIRRDAQDVRS
jgi:4a-hydroxytetrahydrobiopterin dehydratase